MKQKLSWSTRAFGHVKLRHKLLAAFFSLSLVPLFAVGTYACLYIHASIIERGESSICDAIRQFEASISHRLQQYEQVLQYLTLNNQISTIFHTVHDSYYELYYDMEKIYSPMLVSIREMNRDIASIGIYTDNPSLRPRKSDVMFLNEINGHPLAEKALASYGVFWDVEDDELVAMSRVLKLSKNGPNNVACMRIPIATLFEPFSCGVGVYSLALFEGDRLLISRTYGSMVFAPDQCLHEDGTTATIAGAQMLIVRQTIAQTGWQLVFCCPYELLHMDLTHLICFVSLAVLISLATTILISRKVSGDVTDRIEALNMSMTQVEQGNLREVPQPWETDEIGDLTRHFSRMLNTLNRHIETDYKNQLLLRDAEIRMLQSQINPHFLYNILSMVNWMALAKEEIEISEVLMQLSEFYRMILNRGNYEVTVSAEIAHVTCYLELQARLHENSFDIVIDVPDSMMEYTILGVILQPIVENAIQHGIDALRSRRGLMKIEGRQRANELLFTIADNGPGMSKALFEETLGKSSKGYGLKNVNDRLKIAYGDAFGLSMAETCASGTAIVVKLPALVGAYTNGCL